jgi:hypothetical protein
MTSHPLDAETALIAEWRRRATALTDDREVMRDDRVKARMLNDCANELESLLSTRRGSGSDQETK